MNQPTLAFTAVFLKSQGGYVGFVEELPQVSAHGPTLEETRASLKALTELVFQEERRSSKEQLAGKDVQREPFYLAVPATL